MRWSITKIVLIASSGLVVGMILLCGLAIRDTGKIEEAEHAASVDWLPSSASDISYYKSYSFTAYEFKISENDFLEWCKQKNWPVAKIGLSVRIDRCSFNKGRDLPLPPTTAPNDPMREYNWQQAKDAMMWKSISHGWFYGTDDQRGGGLHVGYDLDDGRAYYHDQPR